MVFEYYPDDDMLYIRFNIGKSTESEEISPGIVLDYNSENQLLGVEIEDASKIMDLSQLELRALPIANLVFSPQIAKE